MNASDQAWHVAPADPVQVDEASRHRPKPSASVAASVRYRGYDITLTLHGPDGRTVLEHLDVALTWLAAREAEPTKPQASVVDASGPAGGMTGGAESEPELADLPACPTHGAPMKPSKFGGYYCTQQVAPDDGTGKPVYCRQTIDAD